MDYINSKYLNSKFLRIWSDIGYSVGRFWDIKEIDWETTEITEIQDIDLRMKELHEEYKWVFDSVGKYPEILLEFQEQFKN